MAGPMGGRPPPPRPPTGPPPGGLQPLEASMGPLHASPGPTPSLAAAPGVAPAWREPLSDVWDLHFIGVRSPPFKARTASSCWPSVSCTCKMPVPLVKHM